MMRTSHFHNKVLLRFPNISFCLVLLFSPLLTAQAQQPAAVASGGLTAMNSSAGQWSAPAPWPIIAVHMSVLPNGKVLVWSRDKLLEGCIPAGEDLCDVRDRRTQARLWDPATGAFTSVPNARTNLFCSGHSFLPDGRLLVTGGHYINDGRGEPHANIFDYTTNRWTAGPDMNAARWYPTNCTLANGEVLVASGTVVNNQFNNLPQVWQTSGGWRNLNNAVKQLPLYPFLHLAPNGTVFNSGPERATRFLDTSGTGRWIAGPSSSFGFRGSGSSVMYDDGKVLIVGGGQIPPTNTAEVINLSWHNPGWRRVTSMAFARQQLNATILADGKILITGGTSGSNFNNANGSVFASEIWDPATERWMTSASMQVRRIYHSVAVLLPDGRVLSAGGGLPAGAGENTGGIHPQFYGHSDMEIYSPPYLFMGARPTISSAPGSVNHGQTFSVSTPNAGDISEVIWVSLPSVTHAFNQNQRINYLSFNATGSSSLNIMAPGSSNLCPPGYYMLFLINRNGVPSVAKILRVSVPSSPGNAINDARYFARQQYYDLLNRDTDRASLLSWSRQMTQCGNDIACREQKRVEIARGFWDSAEFKQKYPAVVNPGGNPAFNNGEFIRLCYLLYLRRNPDPDGYNHWLYELNIANDYNRIIKGFISSTEYRARFGQP